MPGGRAKPRLQIGRYEHDKQRPAPPTMMNAHNDAWSRADRSRPRIRSPLGSPADAVIISAYPPPRHLETEEVPGQQEAGTTQVVEILPVGTVNAWTVPKCRHG